jgi:spore germination protein GerM
VLVRILIALPLAAALVGVGAVSSVATSLDGAASSRHVRIYVPRGPAGRSCTRVVPLDRVVRGPAVLAGAMRALLAGPTAAERKRGYGGWFSRATAGRLRSVRIAAGVAYVDFRDFRRAIPNASSSCGSALLLAQLDRTATQFPSVRAAIYSFSGSRTAFYEWLQREAP